MALVPLSDHIFFLAQLQNMAYLAAYFGTLLWRSKAGIVTREMLAIDKRPFLIIGAAEAVAQLLFMVGAAHIPGPLLPVVNQTYLVWSLLFAHLILGTRYSRVQLLGAGLVVAGVIAAAVSPAAVVAHSAAAAVELRYVAVCVACFAFPAIANCVKERVFSSAARDLGQPLDIFVVNSFGSLAQSLFVVALLPVTLALKGISPAALPATLAHSAQAFLGRLPGADPLTPWLAAGYVVMNLVFNVAILTLLRSVGSVTTTLVGSSLVPLTICAFTLPLPYLEPAVLGPNFLLGATLLMAGLCTYNLNSWRALLGLQRPGAAAQAAAGAGAGGAQPALQPAVATMSMGGSGPGVAANSKED
ncbi:hypothetical protein HYH03_006220 [Edaphochlamys debaryana]|uniref:Uncharacterized protein n=1 Tax=Edaphochlamys debaryana TaxID=47281 RepID=A0A835YB26_9CHLO|nr:hypothetical protein HYH03_006220 [Edaphochlamys debaryana]|eukprot:KAG2495620.1 hypothetical protein HYH03_006220 [Edaphochlamys debaryana]